MQFIFKTWKKATYFEGIFKIRKNENMAIPIAFPTVFTAYGKAIKTGNWESCTSINTPDYVINNYFDGRYSEMEKLWAYCKLLEKVTWVDVENNVNDVLKLITLANNELSKLKRL